MAASLYAFEIIAWNGGCLRSLGRSNQGGVSLLEFEMLGCSEMVMSIRSKSRTVSYLGCVSSSAGRSGTSDVFAHEDVDFPPSDKSRCWLLANRMLVMLLDSDKPRDRGPMSDVRVDDGKSTTIREG